MKSFTVEKNDSGQRLDKFLTKFCPKLPKALMYKYIRIKRIKINGKRAEISTKLNVGDVVDAKVVKLMPFGAFAEILPGVDGLIHISQIADRHIAKPEDALSEGQDVQVKITDVDAENKRISLSIRALLAPAAEETAEETVEDAE